MTAEAQYMILRAIELNSVRKTTLSSWPASVDALINILEEQLELDLSLQNEDPDFDGKLKSLVDSAEFPQKAVGSWLISTRFQFCSFN